MLLYMGKKIEAGKFSNVKLTLHIDLTMHVSVLQWSSPHIHDTLNSYISSLIILVLQYRCINRSLCMF